MVRVGVGLPRQDGEIEGDFVEDDTVLVLSIRGRVILIPVHTGRLAAILVRTLSRRRAAILIRPLFLL